MQTWGAPKSFLALLHRVHGYPALIAVIDLKSHDMSLIDIPFLIREDNVKYSQHHLMSFPCSLHSYI